MVKFQLTQQEYRQFLGDAVILFTHSSYDNKHLESYFKLSHFEQKIGHYLHISLPSDLQAKHLIIISLGDEEIVESNYHQGLKTALDILKQYKIKDCWVQTVEVSNNGKAQALQNAVVNIMSHLYVVPKPYTEPEPTHFLEDIYLASDLGNTQAIDYGLAIASGQYLSRELADLPSNICTPTYLAETAKSLAAEYGLACRILNMSDMQTLGMNSLVSVARGSDEPAKLIVLHYQGGDNKAPVALVGKGVTFDSGGISIKASLAMDEMKYDMCGGASVLGTIKTIAQLKLKLNLVVVIPSVENMPSAHASKPGDIVKSLSGQTIEILNTDAEGRLILCDAMTYVQQQYKPRAVIDIATLTGAVIVALGRLYSGAMGNDEALIKQLKTAGKQSGDGVWQLPLEDEYDKLLKSNFADMANIGNREAGSVVAACFLSRFTKKVPWVHLDIAGSAWNTGTNKGATGRPVPLLVQYLLNQQLEIMDLEK